MLLLYLSSHRPVASVRELFSGLSETLGSSRVASAGVTFINLRMSLRSLGGKGLITFSRGARNSIIKIRLTRAGRREAVRLKKVLRVLVGE
jgi:hypothetical protein